MSCKIIIKNLGSGAQEDFSWDASECKAMDSIAYFKLEWLWNFIVNGIRRGFDFITEQAWDLLPQKQQTLIINREGFVGSVKQLSRATKEEIVSQTPFMDGAESHSISIFEDGLPVNIEKRGNTQDVIKTQPTIEISKVEFAALKKIIIHDILTYLQFNHGQKLIEFMRQNPKENVEVTIKKFNSLEPMLGSQSTWLFWWVRNTAMQKVDTAINELVIESVKGNDLTPIERKAIAKQIGSPFFDPQKLSQMPVGIKKDICGLSKTKSGREKTDLFEAR